MHDKWKIRVSAALSFILPLCVFIATLLPTVGGFGDSPKFQFTGKSLSIPHPSGFPVYLWITHFASYLPIGDLAYRTNLVSALFGALTTCLLFGILRQISLSPTIALGATLMFAFSSTFWSVSLIAEVYSLNSLFMAAVILLLWKWREGGRSWYFDIACVLYGLSLGNHLVTTIVFPAAVYWVITARKKFLSEGRYATRAALFLSAAIVPYLWLYLRFGQAMLYKEVPVGSLGEFVGFVMGSSFASQRFPFTLKELLLNAVPMYGSLLRSQYGILAIIIGLVGLVRLWRRAWDKAIFLMIVFACDLIIGLNGTSSEMPIYYVPSYLIFAIWIGCAFMPRAKRPSEGKSVARLLAALFLCLYALRLFYDHLPLVNLRGHTFYGDVADRVLESVPVGGVLLSPNYNWTEVYLYKLLGEDMRRGDDVRVLHYWEPGRVKEYLSGQSISPAFYDAPQRAPGKTRVFLHALSMRDPRIAKLASKGFDLKPAAEHRSALARSLKEVPPGQLLLLSMRDEGIALLNDNSYDALSALGLRAPVSKGVLSGWGFAAILTNRDGKLVGPQASRFKPVRLFVRQGEKIPRTGIKSPVDILVESRGVGRGDLSQIEVAGRGVQGGRHGLNFAYVDARSGKVIRSGNVRPSDLHTMRESFLFEVVRRVEPGMPSLPPPK
jgi:hypothetical protein